MEKFQLIILNLENQCYIKINPNTLNQWVVGSSPTRNTDSPASRWLAGFFYGLYFRMADRSEQGRKGYFLKTIRLNDSFFTFNNPINRSPLGTSVYIYQEK